MMGAGASRKKSDGDSNEDSILIEETDNPFSVINFHIMDIHCGAIDACSMHGLHDLFGHKAKALCGHLSRVLWVLLFLMPQMGLP